MVGKLKVIFNDWGVVESCLGIPYFMLADNFKRKNEEGKRVELTGDARASVVSEVQSNPFLSTVAEDINTAAKLAIFEV